MQHLVKKGEKLLFLHPMIRSYRLETWQILNKKFPIPIHYFFTNTATLTNPKYLLPGVKKEVENCLSQFNSPFTLCREFRSVFTPNNLCFDFLPSLFHPKSRGIVFSSMTSIPFLLFFPLAKFLGKKVFLFEESWHYQEGVPFYRWIKPLIKGYLRGVDGVVCTGKASRKMIIQEMGVDSKKTGIAVNSCSFPFNLPFKNKPARTGGEKLKILYLGRVVAYKGLDILIKALSNPDLKGKFWLKVIGAGNYLEHCQSLVRDLELSNWVDFHPPVEQNEVFGHYLESDLFVLPSRFKEEDSVNSESWGFVINEVMGTGTPVLTTSAVGSSFDLIQDGVTGFLVPQGDIHLMAKKIGEIISNKGVLPNIGEAGRKKVQSVASPLISGCQWSELLSQWWGLKKS